MEIKENVKETLKKVVLRHGTAGTSGRVFLPKEWIGKNVLICLLGDE